jgi:hypothetical protein
MSKSKKKRRGINRAKALKSLVERLELGDLKLHQRTIRYLIENAGK